MSGCQPGEPPVAPRSGSADTAGLNTTVDLTAAAAISKNETLPKTRRDQPGHYGPGLYASGDKRLTILLGRDRLLMKIDQARPQQVTGWGSDELWKSLVRMLADLGMTADKQVVRVCAEDDVPWTLTHRLLRTLQTSGVSRLQICSADSVAADMM